MLALNVFEIIIVRVFDCHSRDFRTDYTAFAIKFMTTQTATIQKELSSLEELRCFWGIFRFMALATGSLYIVER